MKTKLSLAAIVAAVTLIAAQPVIQAVAPVTGSSAAFARQGADDKPKHDANDDKGGRHGGKSTDDKPGHDANDDKGGKHGGKGADDKAGHNANDDKGGRHGGRK